jgi:hypothetical protein
MKKDKLKDLFLDCLRKHPNITMAAEKAGVTRVTVFRWRRDDPEFDKQAQEAIAEGTEFMNDIVESVVLNAVKNNNIAAAALYLKSNHPKYSNKLEIIGSIKTNDKLSPEQQALYDNAIKHANFPALADGQDEHGEEDTEQK